MLTRPLDSEYPPYFGKYISQVPDGDLIAHLKQQMTEFIEELKNLNEEQMNFSYGEGKWTMRQVLIHINDVERIFGYRALSCLRSDPSLIPGFEQDDYAEITKHSTRSIENLLEEFKGLRLGNIHLFASATDEEWIKHATISGNKTVARSMAYMIFGHVEHHRKINREKYLA